MNNKLLGYILTGVGLLGIALSYPGVRTVLKIPAIPGINDNYLMIGAAVVFIIGAFLAFRGGGGKQPEEVPIYEGHGKERKVVAIQRMGKK